MYNVYTRNGDSIFNHGVGVSKIYSHFVVKRWILNRPSRKENGSLFTYRNLLYSLYYCTNIYIYI